MPFPEALLYLPPTGLHVVRRIATGLLVYYMTSISSRKVQVTTIVAKQACSSNELTTEEQNFIADQD